MRISAKIAVVGLVALVVAGVFYSLRDDAGPVSAASDGGPAEERGVSGPADPRAAASASAPAGAVPPAPASSGRLVELAQNLLGMQPGPTAQQVRIARDFEVLYTKWDLPLFESMFARPTPADVLEERIDWFHDRLGTCSPGQLMSWRDDLNARYSYTCERGTLEVGFPLDEKSGLLTGLALGARGIDPIDAARDAADAALLLTVEWSDQGFLQTFSDTFELEKMKAFFADIRRKYGACKRGETYLVSARGALFMIDCERGVRLMKVELNDDDKIRGFKISSPPAPGAQAEAAGSQ
ncbi:hypothetical protein [Nannocystis sp. SCPEA4]|uniref:hypothetical protein n=1 Tax=Nannocystis sp. SCPEA4 TaxID=2996787 RepID=UPI002271AF1B|nr:hypothetical protein [Nannocystis sp. SCPEA4]MCY1059008.1 hypothetical protein [Nannocystis sp. SCPEA4]